MAETVVDSKKFAEQYFDSNRDLLVYDLSNRLDESIRVGLQEIKDGKTSSLAEVNRKIKNKYFS